MKITQYNENDFKTSNWSGGTTTELFIYPQTADYQKRNFLFRLSSASVDLDKSEFTPLPGIQRFISPLTGDLKISHDEKYFTKLKPFEIYAFDGGAKTISIGKVRDFNLMVKDKIDTEVKSFFLNSNSVLKFSIGEDEIGWLFSFNNKTNLNIETKKIKTNLQLTAMSLITFEFDDDMQDEREKLFASTNEELSLFYGKIPIKF